jgi:prepilin-type N-terminal cleavage/methylation domain-containing protein/prepilin-type processing-associated H-X9-DG protein
MFCALHGALSQTPSARHPFKRLMLRRRNRVKQVSSQSLSPTAAQPTRAFTLIELLVVIAILSILTALLFPVFSQAREKGRQTQCSSNLKQFAQAWSMYADDYDDTAVLSYNKKGNIGNANDAWDFKQLKNGTWILGMLGPYTTTGQLSACPDFSFPPGYVGRPYNGYAYNATYLGGDMATPSGDFPPAPLATVVYPSQTALFADGGYGSTVAQPENFLRAPSDTAYYYGGLVDFRHATLANVAYVDGHVKIAHDDNPYNLHYPEFGGLSINDSAYGPGMQPCSARAQ